MVTKNQDTQQALKVQPSVILMVLQQRQGDNSNIQSWRLCMVR